MVFKPKRLKGFGRKMFEEKLDVTVLNKLRLDYKNDPAMIKWRDFLHRHMEPKKSVTIGLVGKYVELPDAYKSISESFIHAGAANECKVNLQLIHSEEIIKDNLRLGIFHN